MVASSKDDLMATTLVLGQLFLLVLGGDKCLEGGVATGLSTWNQLTVGKQVARVKL